MIGSAGGGSRHDDPNDLFDGHSHIEESSNQGITVLIQEPVLFDPVGQFLDPSAKRDFSDVDLDESADSIASLFAECSDRPGLDFISVEEDIAEQQGKDIV